MLKVFISGHTCNPSIWKAETEGLQVQGQPWLHSKTAATNKQKPKIKTFGFLSKF
jgi:hypothetical protein